MLLVLKFMLTLKSIFNENICFNKDEMHFQTLQKVQTIKNLYDYIIFVLKISCLHFQSCPLQAYFCITQRCAVPFQILNISKQNVVVFWFAVSSSQIKYILHAFAHMLKTPFIASKFGRPKLNSLIKLYSIQIYH